MHIALFAFLWVVFGVLLVALFALLASTTDELQKQDPKQHVAFRVLSLIVICILLIMVVAAYVWSPCTCA